MKRPLKPRKIRDTLLIVTNGKQTEKNYFNNLTNSFSCMFSIKVEYKNCQCDQLVDYAIGLDSTAYNQIWCVFDIDDSFTEGHLQYALERAKKYKINIAYSNEAFEVWLLYHFKESVKEALSRKTYIKELNGILAGTSGQKFQKNDVELLKKSFIPNALLASERAKKKYQQKEAEHKRLYFGNNNYPVWEWKSTSTVFNLIDALDLKPKNCFDGTEIDR